MARIINIVFRTLVNDHVTLLFSNLLFFVNSCLTTMRYYSHLWVICHTRETINCPFHLQSHMWQIIKLHALYAMLWKSPQNCSLIMPSTFPNIKKPKITTLMYVFVSIYEWVITSVITGPELGWFTGLDSQSQSWYRGHMQDSPRMRPPSLYSP